MLSTQPYLSLCSRRCIQCIELPNDATDTINHGISGTQEKSDLNEGTKCRATLNIYSCLHKLVLCSLRCILATLQKTSQKVTGHGNSKDEPEQKEGLYSGPVKMWMDEVGGDDDDDDWIYWLENDESHQLSIMDG